MCARLVFLTILSAAVAQRPSRYPARWWTPVPEDNKPAWEILPQAAKPGEVILSKRNELGILSNLAATPFTFRGKPYASVEGFWQMMLYPEGSVNELDQCVQKFENAINRMRAVQRSLQTGVEKVRTGGDRMLKV